MARVAWPTELRFGATWTVLPAHIGVEDGRIARIRPSARKWPWIVDCPKLAR